MTDGPKLYTLRGEQALDGELFVRFNGDAGTVTAAIGQMVKDLDRNQVGTPQTVWDGLQENADQMRSLAKIIQCMAGIAILLAVAGVYGVLTFIINRRTREFGIKMMLGATRQTIFRGVMLSGVRQIGIGLVCGVVLAAPAGLVFAHLTQRSNLRISAFDVPVYGISAAILLVVSLAAMYLPAFKATRVDPIRALRDE